jgi:dihydropteroate synthase
MLYSDDKSTKIMGVLNGTPDSFYSNSRIAYNNAFDYDDFKYCDILDVGFESSRPFSDPVDEEEEIRRLSIFLDKFPFKDIKLSIDTYKPVVAIEALSNGFSVINDIKGGDESGKMFEVASSFNAEIVIMHINGEPKFMQIEPHYDNLIDDMKKYFDAKINLAINLGVKEEKIILDPGLGFGKSRTDNYTIINNLSVLKTYNLPILIGLSRKSFLSIQGDAPSDRLLPSLGSAVLAVNNGADIIRVHDVKESKHLFLIIDEILKNKKSFIYEA